MVRSSEEKHSDASLFFCWLLCINNK